MVYADIKNERNRQLGNEYNTFLPNYYGLLKHKNFSPVVL